MEQEQNKGEEQNKELEQNQQEQPVPVFSKALVIGFVGGILWSFVGSIAYVLNFSSVSAATFVLRSWIQTDWTSGWIGEFIGILAVGLLSLGTAIIYFSLLKKAKGLAPAILFGVALWFLIFYLFNPVFSAVPEFDQFESDTIVTTLCLFILYGTFVGYSISYEYLENNQSSQNAPN
ncbi:YqhR family membrane protein [Pontibacillus sp. HMF3514]|uniref:YqhR family membrane protein n=1 Tax=Pontibacillus sp. HMF3514 TaxID=2692425 RepID=UPI0013200FA5|nr:YqhR family membrane protein [Pontibacillus sp. HMF3514]QHE52925.1 hypothetical protein GS400_13220 [Pontibacillus sp. HMF3514]